MTDMLTTLVHRAVKSPVYRSSYTALYINEIYMGLYWMHEELDEMFLQSRFGNNAGEYTFLPRTPCPIKTGCSKSSFSSKLLLRKAQILFPPVFLLLNDHLVTSVKWLNQTTNHFCASGCGLTVLFFCSGNLYKGNDGCLNYEGDDPEHYKNLTIKLEVDGLVLEMKVTHSSLPNPLFQPQPRPQMSGWGFAWCFVLRGLVLKPESSLPTPFPSSTSVVVVLGTGSQARISSAMPLIVFLDDCDFISGSLIFHPLGPA